jgi:hypothetical protein
MVKKLKPGDSRHENDNSNTGRRSSPSERVI